MRWTTLSALVSALACLVALPATADDHDPCFDHAQAVVAALEAGPAGDLSDRERGLALAAAVRGCQAERARIVGAAAVAPADAEPAKPEALASETPSATEPNADPSSTGSATPGKIGFFEGLQRWLAEPVECERFRRANGRMVSRCN